MHFLSSGLLFFAISLTFPTQLGAKKTTALSRVLVLWQHETEEGKVKAQLYFTRILIELEHFFFFYFYVFCLFFLQAVTAEALLKDSGGECVVCETTRQRHLIVIYDKILITATNTNTKHTQDSNKVGFHLFIFCLCHLDENGGVTFAI